MKKFDRNFMAQSFGIVLPQATGILEPADYAMAMDAQSPLITTQNAGIPAYLTNYLDPELIRVLVTPMKAAQIIGEKRKGDWTTKTAQFKMAESTGEVTSYGDFSENGSTQANYQFPSRQSYLFQTMTEWGALELDEAGNAQLNYAADLNTASALALAKFQNRSYFFGIAGLQNYGLLNDPSLIAPITPATKTAGGVLWANATAAEVFEDVRATYNKLVLQTKGLVDRETAMTLALSPEMEANFTKTNTFNVNVSDQLKKNFPNMKVETAVQYATTGGQLMQLIVDKVEGQEVAYAAFNEKMRAHPVIVHASSWKQKKTSGTWGAIIRYPIAIASMLGM